MLGSMLTKEEVEEFMRGADVVSSGLEYIGLRNFILSHVLYFTSRMEMENSTTTNLLR